MKKIVQPTKIAHMGGKVQFELLAKGRHRLRSGLLTQDLRCQITGERLNARYAVFQTNNNQWMVHLMDGA